MSIGKSTAWISLSRDINANMSTLPISQKSSALGAIQTYRMVSMSAAFFWPWKLEVEERRKLWEKGLTESKKAEQKPTPGL